MNKRIQELEKQSYVDVDHGDGVYQQFNRCKFAELIIQECRENFAKVWYEQGMDIRGADLFKFLNQFEKHFGVEE